MQYTAPLLLAAPLLACFADDGSRSSAPAVIESSTGTGDTGTTAPAASESTAPEPTTTTTATTDLTTDVPTTGTVTTDPTGNCELAPQCDPGEVEDGLQCDSCGVQRRTCQTDCTWTAMTCQQDLDTCGYWLLDPKSKGWQRAAIDPDAAFAPKDTVLAAVALAPQKQIYVLTASTYHVLASDTRTWIAAGDRKSLFPQLTDQPLLHATALTTQSPDTIVSLVAGTQVYSYTFIGLQNKLEYTGVTPCCGVNWTGPNAPDPYQIRDGWARLGDSESWIAGEPQTLCGLDEPSPFYGYQLSIGDGFVYPQDIGYCFDFYPPIPFAEFPPFALEGAPANDLIGGAAYLDGLWIFRGE